MRVNANENLGNHDLQSAQSLTPNHRITIRTSSGNRQSRSPSRTTNDCPRGDETPTRFRSGGSLNNSNRSREFGRRNLGYNSREHSEESQLTRQRQENHTNAPRTFHSQSQNFGERRSGGHNNRGRAVQQTPTRRSGPKILVRGIERYNDRDSGRYAEWETPTRISRARSPDELENSSDDDCKYLYKDSKTLS